MIQKTPLTIVSWNVNSVRQRLGLLCDYLREYSPDIVALQEIKCVDEQFPREDIEALGYNIETLGQKTFNGVALLSKYPFDRAEITRGLPLISDDDEPDEQARYIEAVFSVAGRVVRVASIYLPNGNPVDSPKYPYKLGFMARLEAHAQKLLTYEEPLILCGDYNVIPQAEDCYDPNVWAQDALFLPETRARFQRLLNLGFTDALRAKTMSNPHYTFWDYQAGAWPKNMGIRIDHHLLSPQAADCLTSVTIDKSQRALEKPSDHVPIRIKLML